MNWTSNVLAVRIGTGNGAYSSDMAAGIYWAAGLSVAGLPVNKNPARVLNVSFNGAGPCPISVQQAITAARIRGVVTVVAAGNYNQDIANYQPGNCHGVISVAATDTGGNRAGFSNYGIGVTVAAPGTSIVTAGSVNSVWDPSSYNYLLRSGTSFAAPQIAGIVSLMLSVNPSLTPEDVEAILRSSVRAYPSHANCAGICQTGIVDAGTAVWLAAPDAIKVPKPVLPSPPSAPGNASPGASTGSTPSPAPVGGQGNSAGAQPGISGTTPGNTATTSPAPATSGSSSTANPPATTGTTTSPLPASSPTPPTTGQSSGGTQGQGSTGPVATTPPFPRFVRSIAGTNQNVAPGSLVILHGAGQSDSTARVVSYKWIQLTGPAVLLSSSRSAQPSFIAPRNYTTMTFRLIVIDNRGHAASADTKVVTTAGPLTSSSRPTIRTLRTR